MTTPSSPPWDDLFPSSPLEFSSSWGKPRTPPRAPTSSSAAFSSPSAPSESDSDEMRLEALYDVPKSLREGIPDQVLSRMRLNREELRLPMGKRMELSGTRFYHEMAEKGGLPNYTDYPVPKYGPDDELPKGHDWASYFMGSGSKDIVVKKFCLFCRVGLDHWTEECPKQQGKGKEEMCDEIIKYFNMDACP